MAADGPLAEGQIHGWKFRLSAQFPENKADWESKILWECLEGMPLGNQKTARLPVFTNSTGSRAVKAVLSSVLLHWLFSALLPGTNTGSGVGLCHSHILKHLELS